MNTLKIFIRDSLHNIKRNSVMSVASVLSVVCALVIVGVVLAIAINIQYITKQIESNLEVKVYLNDNIPTLVQETIYQDLLSYDGVVSVTFESKEEALAKFKETLGEENASLVASYTAKNSPLPASFIVKMENAEQINSLYSYSKDLEGVRDVIYGEQTVEKLLQFNKFTNTITWIVVAVLSVIAVFIIFNTIKLTVFSRRNEISIMKYVGATDWYIRFPFIIEGSILGLFGAFFSILLLRNIYYFLVGLLQGSMSVLPLGQTLAPAGYVMTQISLIFVIYGILLGTIGSSFSLKKFLNV